MNFQQVFPYFSIKVMVFLLKAWYGLLTHMVSLADFFSGFNQNSMSFFRSGN